MESRLMELEMKLSYQESLVADLNETVINQQKEIDTLKASLSLLTKRIQELRELSGENLPHTRPPHY